MEKEFMTVGELARIMGVTVRTLQYYDREGLLKPSGTSEGGRRLYSGKDMVKLHQILAFKYLGFSLDEIKTRLWSLDTPGEVAKALEQQKKAIEEQIFQLQEVLKDVCALHTEVLEMEKVDFKKYAEIIELLKMENQEYWVWKLMDDTMTEHIKKRFGFQSDMGMAVLNTYQCILEEALELKEKGEEPDSEKSMNLAKSWWDMIMDFTGGDMTLLPTLINFNEDKSGWNEELGKKQQKVDAYLGKALECYFIKNGINIPGLE